MLTATHYCRSSTPAGHWNALVVPSCPRQTTVTTTTTRLLRQSHDNDGDTTATTTKLRRDWRLQTDVDVVVVVVVVVVPSCQRRFSVPLSAVLSHSVLLMPIRYRPSERRTKPSLPAWPMDGGRRWPAMSDWLESGWLIDWLIDRPRPRRAGVLLA